MMVICPWKRRDLLLILSCELMWLRDLSCGVLFDSGKRDVHIICNCCVCSLLDRERDIGL